MRYLFLFVSFLSLGQQLQKVDFTKLNAELSLYPHEKTISGKISYEFLVKSPIDTIKIDAVQMQISDVKINGKTVAFKNSGKTIALFQGYQKGANTLEFLYEAKPKQTLYFVGWEAAMGSEQIWTQGQGKYTSHWLPSFDDVNEKVIFNLTVNFNPDYKVVSNGTLMSTEMNAKGNAKVWSYQMQKPMSSYLVMLAIGKYDTYDLQSKSNIPLQLYLKPADALKYKSTYAFSAEIFNYLEQEIGMKYPWQIYKQVPVHDFLYAGMENTSATLFSQDFVVDTIGYNDRNYVNVNAHELAHQWFGDLITAKSGKHHWLQEGFATYYALLAEKSIFGEDYFNFALLDNAEEIHNASKYDTIPIMNEKASSLSFYKKGAWALHYLHESIGEKAFRQAVKAYLKKYGFQTVETDDFLREISKVSKFDTQKFKKEWLESKTFDWNKALEILSKNVAIKKYLELQKMEKLSFEEKKPVFETILKSNDYPSVKEEVVYQLTKVPFELKKELILLALKTNDIKVRRAVARTTKEIPTDYKQDFEGLLNDNSYATKEEILQKLWVKFPEDRKKYLDTSQQWEGNNDKNFRIIWLTLAMATKEYHPELKQAYYQEIVDYASPQYDGTVRQNALEMLLQIKPSDERVLLSLVNATTHHKWQFVKFAKEQIRSLIKKEEFKTKFQELLPKMSEREQNFMKNELK